jgi:hypothetical protein
MVSSDARGDKVDTDGSDPIDVTARPDELRRLSTTAPPADGM